MHTVVTTDINSLNTESASNTQSVRVVQGRPAVIPAELIAGSNKADVDLLERVWAWAQIQSADGSVFAEPLLDHIAGAALILHEFELGADCVAACLLAHAAADPDQLVIIRTQFGARIAELADGVSRMAMIEALSRASADRQKAEQLEGLRKMLLAMAQDVRVVLVKLADHLQSLRHAVKSSDEAIRRELARLALDIFAPLANRLGVWRFKWEIEDLALSILEPQAYNRIAELLAETHDSRTQFVTDIIGALREELSKEGIKAELSGRPKHIYSIYNKMRRKQLDFDALFDIQAVRVMVDSIKNCYAVLGVVHNLWTPLPKEFDDYIAKPKSNDYRSLHTAVIGPGGKALEVQIRTFDMHRDAELGIAAHWRYKEGSRRDSGYDDKIAWLRQIVQWKDEVADAGQLAADFKSELFSDTIYVLTPQGRVIDLPRDATPIDFAYHVHTELGHRCRGAKVDGFMVQLNTPLKNGQQVEILSAKQGGPSRDWLNPALGFLKSSGARAKVRQYFNKQNYEDAVAQGRDIVTRELQRHGMTRISLDDLAHRLEFDKADDMMAAVGRSELALRQLHNAFSDQAPEVDPANDEPIVRKPQARPEGILVVGVDKLLTVPAKCCKPVPPDPIIGFVTRGRGVTIHRASCVNVPRLAPERLLEAAWGTSSDATFPVDIIVEAADRTGLLRDITEILSRERINVTATNTVSRATAARMTITVEIAKLTSLNRVLALIRDVPHVASAARR